MGSKNEYQDKWKGLFDDVEEQFRSVYVSFVGHFGEADRNWVQEFRNQAESIVSDDCDDYQKECLWAFVTAAYRQGWKLLGESQKDSLRVTLYDDPHGHAGWAILVADCLPGWGQIERVNLRSFSGGAAVPSGCEIPLSNILSDILS